MANTGTVRQIDDLGRIVIPKEIRRTLLIREGDQLEIHVESGKVVLQKYNPVDQLKYLAQSFATSICKVVNHTVVVCNKDRIIAAAGKHAGYYMDMSVSASVTNVMLKRRSFESISEPIELMAYKEGDTAFLVQPIIAKGNVIGAIAVVSDGTEQENMEHVGTAVSTAAAAMGFVYEEE